MAALNAERRLEIDSVLRCDSCDQENPLDTKPTGRLALAYYDE